MRHFIFLFFILLFFSGESAEGASNSLALDVYSAIPDSAKSTVKKASPKSTPSQKQKAEDDTPISFDFAKKKMKLSLFGNEIDIDFKKRDMEINKTKSEESSWLSDLF